MEEKMFGGIDVSSPEIRQLIGQVMKSSSEREKQDKIERFRRLNRYVRPGQILFVGSSLMEQFPIHELMLDRQLAYTIYNRGIGGLTTPEMLKVMDTCVYDLKPAYIFINIGTNDMNGPDYDRDLLMGRYQEILQGIAMHLPEAQVWLLSYYPVNPAAGSKIVYMDYILKYRTNQRIAEANEGVKALADKMGMHYLDVNAGLTDADGNLKAEYTVEGMHMYVDGYRVVLDNLLPTLRSLE